MNTAETLSIDLFMNRLKELSEGLYFLSESDYPLEPIPVTPAAAGAITEPEIYQLAGKPADSKLEIVDLPYFFRNMTADQPEADEEMQNITHRFRELQAFLEGQLQDLKVYRVGQTEIAALILGKLSNTQFAGLKTMVVET